MNKTETYTAAELAELLGQAKLDELRRRKNLRVPNKPVRIETLARAREILRGELPIGIDGGAAALGTISFRYMISHENARIDAIAWIGQQITEHQRLSLAEANTGYAIQQAGERSAGSR